MHFLALKLTSAGPDKKNAGQFTLTEEKKEKHSAKRKKEKRRQKASATCKTIRWQSIISFRRHINDFEKKKEIEKRCFTLIKEKNRFLPFLLKLCVTKNVINNFGVIFSLIFERNIRKIWNTLSSAKIYNTKNSEREKKEEKESKIIKGSLLNSVLSSVDAFNCRHQILFRIGSVCLDEFRAMDSFWMKIYVLIGKCFVCLSTFTLFRFLSYCLFDVGFVCTFF